MEEVSLADQASAIQGHQLLVKIDGEDVQVDPSVQALGFPQRHRAQRTSCKFAAKSSLTIQLVTERILYINSAQNQQSHQNAPNSIQVRISSDESNV